MDTGFFKWVWRFNALAIAAIVSAIGVLILWDEVFTKRPSSASRVLNVDPTDTSIVEALRIGDVTSVNGLIRYSVAREQTYGIGYASSKSTRNNILNYGYLDPATGNTRWLLEGFDALILKTVSVHTTAVEAALAEAVSGAADPEAEKKQIGTLFLIVDKDTSGDNRLSASDIGRLAFALPDGSGLKDLVQGVHSFRNIRKLDDTRRMLHFKDETGEKVAIWNLDTLNLDKVLTLDQDF